MSLIILLWSLKILLRFPLKTYPIFQLSPLLTGEPLRDEHDPEPGEPEEICLRVPEHLAQVRAGAAAAEEADVPGPLLLLLGGCVLLLLSLLSLVHVVARG